MLVYKMYDFIIQDLFKSIPKEELNRSEQIIVEQLQRGVHNTLVNNPNFKGAYPYYKRCYYEMDKAKKLWLELLDNDYRSYIEFFKEVAINE